MGLHQVLGTLTAISLVLLWESWLWEQVGVWILCWLLGLFSSCWTSMPNFNITVFVSYYYIYFAMFGFYLIDNRQKGSGSGGERRWGRTGRKRGRGKYSRDILKIYFQYKRKNNKLPSSFNVAPMYMCLGLNTRDWIIHQCFHLWKNNLILPFSAVIDFL